MLLSENSLKSLLELGKVLNHTMSLDENSDSESSMGEFSAQGYQYEPKFTEEELERILNPPQNAMTELERSCDLWCNCGECMIMPSRRESICCQEFKHYVAE